MVKAIFIYAKIRRSGRGQVLKSGKWVVESGKEFFHLLPELGRGLSCAFFEYGGEVGFFVVPQTKANFRNILVGMDQLVFGFNQPAGFDQLTYSPVQDVFTDEIEISG